MELKISKNRDDIYLIKLSGAMDLYSSNHLKESVMKIIKDKVESVIICLHGVDTIDSAGIGALIAVSSTLKKLKCPLVTVVPEGPVTEALQITRLKGYFIIARSLNEALSLAGKAAQSNLA